MSILHNSIKPSEIFSSEFIINDLPQSARAVLTKGITCEEISSFSGTKITVKGGILSPEEKEKGTEKKPLHLFIQGPNKQSIDLAIQRINNLVLEISQCHNNPLMTANMSQPPPQYINVVQNMQGVVSIVIVLAAIAAVHAAPQYGITPASFWGSSRLVLIGECRDLWPIPESNSPLSTL
ncbi:uncharacterized protein LOC103519021 [Diaphorina citri]|uniref:KH homology domain-containing protein 4 n=1 Tax=Diaphorina citri TaxID=121845 RepID=A0A3Q0JH81_DIACI|nr:uncharacterized protein LOC103519021 [Diaphorina citri]